MRKVLKKLKRIFLRSIREVRSLDKLTPNNYRDRQTQESAKKQKLLTPGLEGTPGGVITNCWRLSMDIGEN